jgi:uncharacterized membrane protein (UPF0127 family)
LRVIARTVRNASKGVVLANRALLADTFVGRLKGLLGRKNLPKGEGLIIEPCSGVHTIGMRFSIDVLFLDVENRVIGLRRGIRPYRFTRLFRKARRVVELPVSTIDDSRTDVGDSISIEATSR